MDPQGPQLLLCAYTNVCSHECVLTRIVAPSALAVHVQIHVYYLFVQFKFMSSISLCTALPGCGPTITLIVVNNVPKRLMQFCVCSSRTCARVCSVPTTPFPVTPFAVGLMSSLHSDFLLCPHEAVLFLRKPGARSALKRVCLCRVCVVFLTSLPLAYQHPNLNSGRTVICPSVGPSRKRARASSSKTTPPLRDAEQNTKEVTAGLWRGIERDRISKTLSLLDVLGLMGRRKRGIFAYSMYSMSPCSNTNEGIGSPFGASS
jgi:hypothetical protein